MNNENKPRKTEVKRSIPGLMLFILREIIYQRRWILLPLWVLLAVIALFFLISGNSYILPAIYIGF